MHCVGFNVLTTLTMKSIEEFSDDEDYMPVSASRYFNKHKAFSKDLSEHANGNGSTNGKAFGDPTSSVNDSDKDKKSVVELDNFAFNRKSNTAKRPIDLLEDDEDVIVTKTATVR